MGLTRRDFFTLGIGAAAAIPLTPIPWKLLDDTAKWSQNWSWIPRPPRGERAIRYSSCTLCPAGCGMQARCVGKSVVGIAPVAAHPVSQGVLCPYAFGAHQLPYHTARITLPLHNGASVSLDTAAEEIARRVKTGTMAIVDERPGRAVSAEYQKNVAGRGGLYIAAGRSESATLQSIARGSGLNRADLGLALEDVRTLVSFGAPVLESWATPGRVLTLWKDKRLAIVQVEATLSKTAALASRWIPANDAAALLQNEDAMRFIRARGPMVAVSGGGFSDAEEQTISALNEGSIGIVRRSGAPGVAATSLGDVPAGSIDVLFVDHGPLGGSLSIDVLRSKLRRDGIIVSLSAYRAGVAAVADYLIPAPAFAESIDDAPTPWDAAVPSYAVAPALLELPAGAIQPLDFINRVSGGTNGAEALIRARANDLFTGKRGELFTFADRVRKPMSEFKSADEVWKAFTVGGCWIDESAKPVVVLHGAMRGRHESISRALRPAIAPPLFTKLDRESRIGRA